MFLQILRSTQLDTHCLQQSRKKKTRCNCLFFEKQITRRVRSHEVNIVAVPCKRCNIVSLRFAGHRTIKMLGLVGPNVWPVSNCTQLVPTLLWFHANGRNKSQHCWAQQCWVLLANSVASVFMGLHQTELSRWHLVTKLINCCPTVMHRLAVGSPITAIPTVNGTPSLPMITMC